MTTTTSTTQQTFISRSNHSDLISCLSFHPSGQLLATGSLDHSIRVVGNNPNTHQWDYLPLEWKGHDSPILSLCWSSNQQTCNNLLATGAADGTIKVWASTSTNRTTTTTTTTTTTPPPYSLRHTLTDPRGTVRSIAFAPPHFGLKLAAISSDSHLRLWECLDTITLQDWTLLEDIDLTSLGTGPSTGVAPQGVGLGVGAQGQGQGQDLGGVGAGAGAGAGLGAAAAGDLPSSSSSLYQSPHSQQQQQQSPFNSNFNHHSSSAGLPPPPPAAPASPAPFPPLGFGAGGSLSSSTTGTGTGTGTGTSTTSSSSSHDHGHGHRKGGTVESDGGWALSWCKEHWWGERLAVASGSNGIIRIIHLTPHGPWSNPLNLLPPRPSHSHSHSTYTYTPATSSLAWSPASGRSYQLLASGSRDGRARVWKLYPPSLDGGGGEDEELGQGGDWRAELDAELDERTRGGAAGVGAGVGGGGEAAGHQGHHGGTGGVRVEWNVTGTVLSTAGEDARVRLWKSTYTGQWRPVAVLSTEEAQGE